MTAYYNEFDPKAAAWLRELIKAGLIAPGDVDERSIVDVKATDLVGYTQCHFFAGIGGWSYALRLAGWPDDRPVWTGSCPCQPFSSAGKQLGTDDPRHLWPAWFRLIRECRPAVVFGEQVAAAIGSASGKEAHMQEVRDREAVLGILRQLERESPWSMQGLHAGCGASAEEVEASGGERIVQEVAGREAWACADGRSQEQGEVEGDGIRSGSCGHSAPSGCWEVRGNRDSVRPEHPEVMECAIAGQGRLFDGLHEGQCSSCPVRLECGGEYVGLREGNGDCWCAEGSSPGEIGRLLAEPFGVAQESLKRGWLDAVFADMEGAGYACGAAVLPACSVGAPHKRERLWFVADTLPTGRAEGRAVAGYRPTASMRGEFLADRNSAGCGTMQAREHRERDGEGRAWAERVASTDRKGECLADTDGAGLEERGERDSNEDDREQRPCRADAGGRDADGAVADVRGSGLEGRTSERGDDGAELPTAERDSHDGSAVEHAGSERAGCIDPTKAIEGGDRPHDGVSRSASSWNIHDRWSYLAWLPCRDGKARPTQPGLLPLAHGVPGRVGLLRGAGNAIVPQVAAAFIEAYQEVRRS